MNSWFVHGVDLGEYCRYLGKFDYAILIMVLGSGTRSDHEYHGALAGIIERIDDGARRGWHESQKKCSTQANHPYGRNS